ncbi:MAG: hypothetical protein ABI895_31810 [Deltaproteobacteria bacterium]
MLRAKAQKRSRVSLELSAYVSTERCRYSPGDDITANVAQGLSDSIRKQAIAPCQEYPENPIGRRAT